MEEGLENRWQRHRNNAELFWQGLEEIGLECYVPLEDRLKILTAVKAQRVSMRRRSVKDY